MKVFSVSNACNACGECVLRTTLLTEDSGGFAVPTPGKYIQEADLSDAERVVVQCPVHALSIIEQNSVPSTGKAGLEELAGVLEKNLTAVTISDVRSSDIAYHAKDYHVDYEYISDEGRRIYPSERKAMEAGRTQFERMFWNRRADFVTNILTQYKHKVLRKYYDLNESGQTVYAEIGQKMETILNAAVAEASSLAGTPIPFSANFTTFHPELENRGFKESCKAWYEKLFVSSTYIRDFCDGLERQEFCRKNYYEGYISTESHESFEYDKKGRQKTIHIYSFEGANEEGRDLVKDILDYIGLAESCGCRPIDEMSADDINHSILWKYRDIVKEEIEKKVAEFRELISKC